ncbi:unnamed protein product [Heligmosomoides polygyrus]|uniref:Cyclic nucleotide-binding domain-containing protein n=1 Tax=Heligmosomoides polygyrus TaxID=6339 RepID=A0A183F3L7_HELPZ|nr:unnamed protein product [Heligmosomoides polygyrus]
MNKYMQWSILAKSPLFQGCEISFLKDLVAELEPRDYGPGEVICAKGELNKEMFIVASGYLKITDHNDITIQSFSEGDIVEDRSLIWFQHNRYRNRRKHDVVSVGFSQVYILFRDDLINVLKDYPDCREKIRKQGLFLRHSCLISYNTSSFHSKLKILKTFESSYRCDAS